MGFPVRLPSLTSVALPVWMSNRLRVIYVVLGRTLLRQQDSHSLSAEKFSSVPCKVFRIGAVKRNDLEASFRRFSLSSRSFSYCGLTTDMVTYLIEKQLWGLSCGRGWEGEGEEWVARRNAAAGGQGLRWLVGSAEG